jgi:hypothetical protein
MYCSHIRVSEEEGSDESQRKKMNVPQVVRCNERKDLL